MIEPTPEMEQARRIAFTIAKAEQRLGLCQTALPVDDRLRALLQEAAMRPSELDPGSYAVAYLLLTGTVPAPVEMID